MKVLPWPNAVVTITSPRCSWHSRFTMTSPRPVPPKRLVAEVSTWVKGTNSAAHCSGVMPMPVSATSMVSSSACQRSDTRTSPWSVNFSELPMRLIITWASRCRSPIRVCGTWVAASTRSPMPFASALGVISRSSSFNTARGENATRSSRIAPASTLLRSSRSLSSTSSPSEDSRTVSRHSRWVWVSSSRSSRSVSPTTAFIGVRSSWLMFARNAVFTRVPSRAASYERLSSFCAWVRSFTSVSSSAAVRSKFSFSAFRSRIAMRKRWCIHPPVRAVVAMVTTDPRPTCNAVCDGASGRRPVSSSATRPAPTEATPTAAMKPPEVPNTIAAANTTLSELK